MQIDFYCVLLPDMSDNKNQSTFSTASDVG